MLKSLPVLMYHYISSWPNPIAVDPDVFEAHLEGMTKAGYRGVSLAEAEACLREGRSLPEKSVLITFDDGFLDNFVYAWPLLAKHGHKGTIFTVTNKIVDRDLPRPTLDDVWSGFLGMDELPQVNTPHSRTRDGLRVRTDLFFSWKEARLMENSDIVSIAGHTHTHRSVFTGPRFEKLFTTSHRRRTFDRIEQKVVLGLPNFERGPAMANRAFLPSDEVYELVASVVPQGKGEAREFFAHGGNEHALLKKLQALPQDRLGRMETEDEFRQRLTADLAACREALVQNLGHPVRSLAWPWGEYAPEALEIAKGLGFTTFFTTALGPNVPGKSAEAAHRFKAKNKSAKWLLSRLSVYSKPLVARIYAKMHS